MVLFCGAAKSRNVVYRAAANNTLLRLAAKSSDVAYRAAANNAKSCLAAMLSLATSYIVMPHIMRSCVWPHANR